MKKALYFVLITIFVIALLLLTSLEFKSLYIDFIKDALLILVIAIDSLAIWLLYD